MTEEAEPTEPVEYVYDFSQTSSWSEVYGTIKSVETEGTSVALDEDGILSFISRANSVGGTENSTIYGKNDSNRFSTNGKTNKDSNDVVANAFVIDLTGLGDLEGKKITIKVEFETGTSGASLALGEDLTAYSDSNTYLKTEVSSGNTVTLTWTGTAEELSGNSLYITYSAKVFIHNITIVLEDADRD